MVARKGWLLMSNTIEITPGAAPEIAHNLLLAHTGSEGGSPTINWYGLRAEIADAIAVALDKQRHIEAKPALKEIGEFVLDWLPSDAAGDDFKARLVCKLDLLNTTERR